MTIRENPNGPAEPWVFSDNAKTVRRYLYERFATCGCSENVHSMHRGTGLSITEVKEALDELERGVMLMLERDTDDVLIKCPPWANFPTRHEVEKDGQRITYAGCAYEAVNISYCYPGERVTIRSYCPQCTGRIGFDITDDDISTPTPETAMLHIGVNPRDWPLNWVHACANNNFFCSQAHVDAWERAHPEHRGVAIPIARARELTAYRHRYDYERGPDGSTVGVLDKLRKVVTLPSHWE